MVPVNPYPCDGVVVSTITDSFRAVGVAAFEAAVLVRCTGVCGGGRTRALGGARVRTASGGVATATGAERASDGFDTGSGREGGARDVGVAEFSRIDAAHRLVELLAQAGRPAAVDSYTAGNRHRYDIHRVNAPADTQPALQAAWHVGYGELCGQPGTPRTARQLRHALALAAAAWRAALLVVGPKRSGSPGLRVPDLDTATALVRAGRMLELPIRMSTRPGGQLLIVLPADAPRERLTAVTLAA
jgi:hypothetical protein